MRESPSLLRNVGHHVLGLLIDLLHVLWFTSLGQKETKDKNKTSPLTEERVKCLPLPLVNDFLCVAFTVCRHLR